MARRRCPWPPALQKLERLGPRILPALLEEHPQLGRALNLERASSATPATLEALRQLAVRFAREQALQALEELHAAKKTL